MEHAHTAVHAYLAGTLDPYNVRVNHHSTNHLVILNYTDACQANGAWDPVTLVCRGLILHRETGEVVALPFPKFFNIGERPETLAVNLPDESFMVFEKADGSLGIMYRDADGQPCLATRGSFDSPPAIRGTVMLRQLPNIMQVPTHLTLLFEIISHESREVIEYDEEGLVLLAIMNRETGEELPWHEVVKWAQRLDVRTPTVFQFGSIEELVGAKATLPADLEGFVVRFDSGLRVKLKGDAYLQLLRIKRGINRRKIWVAVQEGTLDQYLTQMPEELVPYILAIVDEYKALAEEYENTVRAYFAQAPHDIDPKGFAQWVADNVPEEFRPPLFALARGREPNWVAFAKNERRQP